MSRKHKSILPNLKDIERASGVEYSRIYTSLKHDSSTLSVEEWDKLITALEQGAKDQFDSVVTLAKDKRQEKIDAIGERK